MSCVLVRACGIAATRAFISSLFTEVLYVLVCIVNTAVIGKYCKIIWSSIFYGMLIV